MNQERSYNNHPCDNSLLYFRSMPETKTTTPKRRRSMNHSRFMMATRVAAVVLVSTSAASTASAFVEIAPKSSPAILRSSRRTSSSSTSTSIGAVSLEQVSDFYQNFPVQSAVLTCGVKASVADTIAQVKPQIEENKNKNKQQLEQPMLSSSVLPAALVSRFQPQQAIETSKLNIDWEARRNFAYVLYGGIFVGLMSQVEYSMVFPALFGTEKTVAITTAKVFFDNLLVAPTVWLPPAYFIKAWVYGTDDGSTTTAKGIFEEGLAKYITDVRDNGLLWKYWTIWFPAQSISFSVIPDHLRVAFMASISFFWFILFSTVSSQGDGEAASETTTK